MVMYNNDSAIVKRDAWDCLTSASCEGCSYEGYGDRCLWWLVRDLLMTSSEDDEYGSKQR